MLGHSDNALVALEEGLRIEAELGWSDSGQVPGTVHMLTGDLVAAEASLRDGVARLDAAGGIGQAATSLAMLAQVLLARGAIDDAMAAAEPVEPATSPTDMSAIIPARCVRAEVLAKRGDFTTAIDIAASAVELAETTDWPGIRGDARLSLARVLAAAGKRDAAVDSAVRAEGEFLHKGNIVSAKWARDLITEWATGESP